MSLPTARIYCGGHLCRTPSKSWTKSCAGWRPPSPSLRGRKSTTGLTRTSHLDHSGLVRSRWRIHLHSVLTKKESGNNSRSLFFLLGLKIRPKPPSSARLSSSPNERAVPPRSCCVQPGSSYVLGLMRPLVLSSPTAPSAQAKPSVAQPRTGSDVAESLRLVLPTSYALPRAVPRRQ